MNKENVPMGRNHIKVKFKSNTLHIKYREKGELKKIHKLHPERLQNRSYGREERRM